MRPRQIPQGAAAEVRERRNVLLYELSDGRRHILGILRDPNVTAQGIPTGDLLCWAPGLDDAAVTRILLLAKVPWGRRVGLLSRHDVEAICFWTKDRYPEVWQDWREMRRGKAMAA